MISIIDNEYGCELAEGGYVSIAAVGMYYVCLIIVCCLSTTPGGPLLEEKKEEEEDDDDTTVRTREGAMMDHPHPCHDWDNTSLTGGVSQRSWSRSVHFWDK